MSVTISLRSPTNGASRVAADAAIVVELLATGEVFTTVSITVDGVAAYTFAEDVAAFAYPGASGATQLADDNQVVTLRMRRRFQPGSRVQIRVAATTDVTTEAAQDFHFSVDEPSGSVRDVTLRRTRVDTPFPARVLELYRQAAVGAVGAKAGSVLVALIHRVKSSQMACLLPVLPITAVTYAASLQPQEVEPVSRLADASEQLDFMRSSALSELNDLRVPPEVTDTLARGFGSKYPQERAAALALTVLLAADKL